MAALLIVAATLFYNITKKIKKQKIAQENSQFIIDNLDNEIVYNEFPEEYFPRPQMVNIIRSIKQNCDWQHRDGKFVDFYTMKNIGGNEKNIGSDQTAFIYEYYLKCDSLRFIFIYDMDKSKPELFKLNIEPLEKENSMIIFPEKQLKNRR